MALVMRVQHLSFGTLNFSDDELLELEPTPLVRVQEEVAQTGGISAIWLGEDMLQFDMVFRIFYRNTLVKLNQIRAAHDTFRVYPFLTEAPLTWYQMIWTDSQFKERWVRGRMAANWDLPVTWKESRETACEAPVES